MSKAEKLFDAMRNNPRDWSIDHVKAVAKRYGLECRNRGGSHHVFSHPTVAGLVTVPAHRPIKPVYIVQFVALVDTIRSTAHE
jgi:predicted RNA binding protein YcfA (HicA-like mRNA interferase family)